MSKTNKCMLDASEILALLHEFNSEAENIISHLDALEFACKNETASFEL